MEVNYKVITESGLIMGYFKTKALAHQWILNEYPSSIKVNGKEKGCKKLMPEALYIIKNVK